MKRRWRLLRAEESGLTLIELLVAATMSVILVGAASLMLISAVRSQPQISERAQDVSTARWVLERMTREIRNGIAVDKATATEVSFRAYVRHASCGSSTALAAEESAIVCQVTYTCAGTACTRIEAEPGVYTGTARQIFEGIEDPEVFTYSPSAVEPTFIGATLRFANPEGEGSFTISDGASLRGGDPFGA